MLNCRTLLCWLGLLLGASAVGAADPPLDPLPAGRPSDDRPPNIVLILADDLGYADLACYGALRVRTPVLDALARDGTRCTQFVVAHAVCTASRAALLTGCYSPRVGLAGALNHTSRVGLAPSEVTLAEICRQRGYATAIFGKWHLGHQPEFLPTQQGFDRFAGLPYSNDNGPLHPTVRGIPPLPWYEDEHVVATDPDQSQFTQRLTDLATAWIHQQRERPFFLYLPHIMPHVPIFASPQYRGRSQAGLYGDVIEELDTSIGRILKQLLEDGLAQQTIVLFLSDNGPFLSYGTHAGSAGPLREGKLTTFEGGVRVPCLIRWPGRVPAGRTLDEPFASIDLLPSLTKLIGGQLPEARLDGQDVSGLLLGASGASGRDQFLYYSGNELQAIRHGRWKLHLPHEYLSVAGEPGRDGKPANFARMKPNAITESGVRGIASRHGYEVRQLPQSLFDLSADPGETTDLASRHPQVVADLLAIAERARADLGDSLTDRPGVNNRPVGSSPSGSGAR